MNAYTHLKLEVIMFNSPKLDRNLMWIFGIMLSSLTGYGMSVMSTLAKHYDDVIMSAMASQITNLMIVYLAV